MKFLERPIGIVHEPVGQPVEQFGVSGARAHLAEVAGSGDEPLAEVVLPNAVHDDAGG